MNNNPQSELFSRMVSGLTDNDLDQLSSVVYWEEDKRNMVKLKEGKFPELTTNERVSIKSDYKIGAIKDYRDRTGVSLRVAKMVVESFIDFGL